MGAIWSALLDLSRAIMEAALAIRGRRALENARAPTEWELLLAALQRNDASVTEVNMPEMEEQDSIPRRYGHSLGSALLHNTSVHTLSLDVSRLLSEEETVDDWATLLHYVATSAVLQTVVLRNMNAHLNTPTNHVALSVSNSKRLLRDVGRNNNICSLAFFRVYNDPEILVDFINQTTSLVGLALAFPLSDESSFNVVEALADNAYITHLWLDFVDVDDMFPNVLQVLHQNLKLQSLALSFDRYAAPPGHVWSSLLESGMRLLSLSLHHVSFDGDAMTQLMDGLIGRDTVIDLGLHRCFFSDGAVDALTVLLPIVGKWIFLRLTIDKPRYRRDNPQLYGLAEALYSLQLFHLAISLDQEETCALLGKLTIKSPRHMTSIELKVPLRPAEIEALATFVKSAVHLKKLSIVFSEQSETFRMILEEALRENGSLRHACEGLTDVYHRRNANLRWLLKRRPMPLELENLSLMPSLFQAAKAAKKMAANFIFAGLLGCDHLDNVHHRGQLRMRPVSDLE
jgi:hypothetical protein